MKKSLILAALLASGLMAHAETLRVRVPVAHSTTGTMLPAGEYTATRVNGSSSIFLFEGNGVKSFVYGHVEPGYGLQPATFELQKPRTTSLKAAAAAFALTAPAKK